MTDVKEQGFASNFTSYSAKRLPKHTEYSKKHWVIIPYARPKPTIGLSVSREGGFQSMMKRVLDELRTESRRKMWQILILKASCLRGLFRQYRR